MKRIVASVVVLMTIHWAGLADFSRVASGAELLGIAEARLAIERLAKIQDPNEFAIGYLAFLERHGLHVYLTKGSRTPLGSGGFLRKHGNGEVAIEGADNSRIEMGSRDFIRLLNANGEWSLPSDSSLREAAQVVIRTKGRVVVVNREQGTVGFLGVP
jgi:hypothetical protein